MSIARKRLGKLISVAMDTQATIKKLLGTMFSVWFVQSGYKRSKVVGESNKWPWVPAGLDAKSDRAGWLPTVSYCSALVGEEEVSNLRQ
jgi:hypothetical protein